MRLKGGEFIDPLAEARLVKRIDLPNKETRLQWSAACQILRCCVISIRVICGVALSDCAMALIYHNNLRRPSKSTGGSQTG